jgi:hypothetical protein
VRVHTQWQKSEANQKGNVFLGEKDEMMLSTGEFKTKDWEVGVSEKQSYRFCSIFQGWGAALN